MSGSVSFMKKLKSLGSHSLEDKIQMTDRKFELACAQMTLLSNQIEAVKTRCQRAKEGENRTHYELQKLRLSTLEGVYQKYYEYTYRLARVLDAMCSKQKTLKQNQEAEGENSEE